MMYITKHSTQDAGGGCLIDVITLASGRVLIIADEGLGVYASLSAYQNGEDHLSAFAGGFQQCDERGDADDERSNGPASGAVFSEVGLAFVESFDVSEPDGPVTVDLLNLPDGRVIGIDGESVVLYPSREAFDAQDGSEGFPSMSQQSPLTTKRFLCVWGVGYTGGSDAAIVEENDGDFFTSERGYTDELRARIDRLELGGAFNVPGVMEVHSIVRIA